MAQQEFELTLPQLVNDEQPQVETASKETFCLSDQVWQWIKSIVSGA